MTSYGLVPVGGGKVTIASKDEPTLQVSAQYNPKELQVDRTVPWSPTGETNNANNDKQVVSKHQGIHLEFTGAQGRSISVELLFDGYEKRAVGDFSVDVAGRVAILEQLASVREPGSNEEKLRRPHLCVVNWGSTLRAFQCVIESLSTKYTMFDEKGNPLRAVCTVKLKEADSVGAKKEAAAAPTAGNNSGSKSG